MRLLAVLMFAVFIALLSGGCSDEKKSEPSDAVADTAQDTTVDTAVDQVADTEPPTNNYRVEEQDYADCIVGCANESARITIDADTFAGQYGGLLGQIDGQEHNTCDPPDPSNPECRAGDIDVYKVVASPRAMIEFEVAAVDPGSNFNPVIYTHNGMLLMTFNDDAAAGSDRARTTVAYPYVNDLGLFLIVEDGTNYETRNTAGATFNGGEGYDYLLTVTTTPFAPIELGTLNAGDTPLAQSGAVSKPGDVVYYRLETGANTGITVALTRTGTSDFWPTLVPLDTTGGQLLWPASECAEDPAAVTIDFTDPSFNNLGTERVFIVEDCNGIGGSSYTFDLVITAE